MSVAEYQMMFPLKSIFYNFYCFCSLRAHNILIDSLWNEHFGFFLILDGGHLGFSHEGSTHFLKYIFDNLLLLTDAFSYFMCINLTFLHLYGKYYYYVLNKSMSYINACMTDGGHFGFYALENSARLFKRGIGAYFFTNTLSHLKQPSNLTCRRLVMESWFLLGPTNMRSIHFVFFIIFL